MNSYIKTGLTLFIIGIILLILNLFFLPYLAIVMLFSGSYVFIILMWIFWILIFIFIPVGIILILIGLVSEPRHLVVDLNQNLRGQYESNIRDYMSKICSKCGKKIPHDSNICPYCGNNFNEIMMDNDKEKTNSIKFCAKCGVKLEGKPIFCFKCGFKLR